MSWQTDLDRAPLGVWLSVTVRSDEGEITRIGWRGGKRWHLVGCSPDLPVLAWDQLPQPLRTRR